MAVAEHNGRLGSVDKKNSAAVAAYNAEKAQGDVWKANLDAADARLDQEKADYLARYDTIKKQTDPLYDRTNTLSYEDINSRYAIARAKAKADYLAKVLAAQGVSPDGP